MRKVQTREEKRASLIEWEAKYGHDRKGSSMQHLLDLDDEFPSVEMFGPQCISAQVGPGWSGLLREALVVLASLGGKLGQVKQKFGGLRIYWDPPEALRQQYLEWCVAGSIGSSPYDLSAEYQLVRSTVDRASELSLSTCEHCSAPIDPPRLMSYQTLCDGCAK